jgi:GTP-binding protein
MAEDAFSPEALETARVLFARPSSFLMGAAEIDQLPDTNLPEVAFAGRSNVGKSSLINALAGRKDLARASNEPGRTREVNLFDVDERLRLVDLPGYGFAKAAKTTARKFQNLGRAYLRGRPNLMRAYLLIDSRHGLKAPDLEAMDALDQAAVSYQIVLTKADKLKPAELDQVKGRTLQAIARRPAAYPEVLATSAAKGTGLETLRAGVAAVCGLLGR